eukprot:c23524_g1_i2 orf=303-1031(-)
MRDKKSPPPPSSQLAAATPSSLLNASTPSSSSSSPSSVLSALSSQSSSLSTSFTSFSPPPRPPLPPFSFLKAIRTASPARVSAKKSSSKPAWVNKFLKLGKLPMEAAHHDEGLLLQKAPEGFHGSWGDADDGRIAEKPKKELRFAAKIAAAMDADGFIGVRNSVCAGDSVCVKDVNVQYCMPSTPLVLQRIERAPLKQARPRRRWKLCRRMRRPRVLFACMLRKVRKAFTFSSKRTLKCHNE